MNFMENLKFDQNGLIPAIAQDISGKVLMMAWMNRASIENTLETGYATYFSRSRQALWKKGETSGNTQKLVSMKYDCDGDTILLTVEQKGPACHTGSDTCFFNDAVKGEGADVSIIQTVYDTVIDRMHNPKEGSYTNYLLDKGMTKICKKIGEEASEVIIGAVSKDRDNVKYEVADLLYHLTVLLADMGLTWQDIYAELEKRHK